MTFNLQDFLNNPANDAELEAILKQSENYLGAQTENSVLNSFELVSFGEKPLNLICHHFHL